MKSLAAGKMGYSTAQVGDLVAGSVVALNPKAEIRDPKEIRSSKSELGRYDGGFSWRVMSGCGSACIEERQVVPSSPSHEPTRDFGLRISDFLRVSDFGFRISRPDTPRHVEEPRGRTGPETVRLVTPPPGRACGG